MEQDPLPEPQWFFRRIFTWGVTLLAAAGVGFIIGLAPRDDLQLIALFLVGLISLLATLYLIAPSAPELAAIFRELRGRLQVGGDRRPNRRDPSGD